MRRAAWPLAVMLGIVAGAARADAPPCPLARGETRAVTGVIDGETLALDDGRRLRLIGALAPRAVDVGATAGSWPPENEARTALASLVEGRSVTLWHDAARSDRYGQVLAHVTIGSDWLQGMLVARGLARAYGRPGSDACTAALANLEHQARAQGLGLWANAAYRVRLGAHGDWERAVGSFHLARGTVHRASRGAGEVYVSLGLRRGRAYPLAAVVPANRTDLTGGVAPRALVGRRVLVRGWVEQRRGPVIVIDSKGQFELIGE
ncbi:MAG: thermonuclease family protein [Hyphomicrobiaceae bacterium]